MPLAIFATACARDQFGNWQNLLASFSQIVDFVRQLDNFLENSHSEI